MAKPLLLPEPFDGETTGWLEWMDHFESVAAVNKWVSGEDRLKWLRVRLTGKAQTAFRRLPDDVKADYGTCVEALQRRFNPDSKRQLYMVELNARTKRRDEDWAAFGDAVRVLADKAYPELAENARERLALNQFLEQIENSQVAFSVKQKRPRNVEEAAAAVIELESYLRSTGKPSRVNAVSSQEQESETHHTVPAEPVSAVTSQDGRDSLTATMKSLCERLQRVEVLIGEKSDFVIDTGAAVSLVRRDVWEQIVKGDCTLVLEQWAGRRLVGVNGAPLSVSGCKKVDIFLNGMPFKVMCVVTDDIMVEAILGLDFVNAHNGIIDCGSKRLTFPSRNISVPLQMQSCPLQQNPIGLIVKEKIVIPAASEVELMVDLATPVAKGTWVVTGNTSARHGVMVAHAVVCPNAKPVPVRVVNPREEIVVLKKGTEIAHMELLEQDPVIEISTVAEKFNISREDQSLLWEMVSRVGDDVNKDEKEELFSLLLEFADVFSLSTKNLGHTKVLQHRIDTGNAQPVHLPPRRIPHARREELKEMLRDMLEKNAIEHSDSPWSSPIVLVKKKDGTTRFCVDYRKVNEVTRKDAYPLPRVDDTLDTLAGSKFFSTLDLTTGYWQVEVAPEDQPKTAFTTPEGLYQFKVMPFGLCNAPATFQRLMDRVLGGLKWSSCLVYFDDIIVVGRTFKDHLHHLSKVLAQLRGAGLKLKPTKCSLCQQRVAFLGHIVSAEGIATDPSKTDAVSKWPTPLSKKEVQQFLGLANYYRRFVKNFASISKPLHRLTEKNVPFDWTIHCQNAFDELRKCLVSSPILAYPDYNRRYILDTDASDTGIGAVLSQISDEGSERVIAYASRSLSRPEQRYCVTRKELLAVVSFVQQFRQYLLGREFTLRTDHGSLVWIRNFKEPEGQLARWLEKLQEYNFTVVHRQGSRHCNADALSRVPCRQCGRENQNVETSQGDNAVITGIGAVLSPFQTCTPNEMRKLQLQDEAIGPVYRAVLDRKTPSADVSKSWSWESRVLMQHWGSLNIQNGVLWRKCIDKCRDYLQLVLPAKLQVDTLRDLHEGAIGGHLGEEKMLNKLKERFYWPGCTEAVKDWCRTCIRCTTRKTAAPKRKAPLQSLRAGYPMQIVCVDIMGPLPETEDGCKYVLVASDCFTRWVEVYGIPNQEATTVAKKLVDEMFCRFSPPEQLHSDQGRQFESELVKEICVLLQIRKTHTTPYHPQCNGMVERFNRTLLDMLATTIDNHQADWQHHIRKLCLAYNSSIHSTTGFSPFFLMFGRQVKLPIDLMYGTNRTGPDTAAGFAQKLKEGLQEAYKLVREKCQAEHKRQKALYDERVHGKPFSPGDLVWLHSPAVPRGRSRKLHHPWKGPLKVVERLGESNYKIKSLQGRKKTQIVHFDRLKPCVASTAEDRQNSRPPTTPETQIDRQPTGKYVELLDSYDDEPVAEEPATDAAPPPPQEINIQPRYPVRNRHPPDRYGAYVEH
eukprot:Em0017g251a